MVVVHFMRDRSVLQRDLQHALLGIFPTLADGIGDFARFAQAKADPALLVTHDDEGAEAETATTLHDLGRAVDENHLLGEFIDGFAINAVFLFTAGTGTTWAAIVATATATTLISARFSKFCHNIFSCLQN
jgi:hypothetical protein